MATCCGIREGLCKSPTRRWQVAGAAILVTLLDEVDFAGLGGVFEVGFRVSVVYKVVPNGLGGVECSQGGGCLFKTQRISLRRV